MIKLVAYHIAWKRDVQSILKQGLLKSKSMFYKERGGCVYLYKNRAKATSVDRHQFEIDITGLNLTISSSWEIICWDDILPERIFGNKVIRMSVITIDPNDITAGKISFSDPDVNIIISDGF